MSDLSARDSVLKHFTREELDERYEMAVVLDDCDDATFYWACRQVLVGVREIKGDDVYRALERDFTHEQISDALVRLLEATR